jgi:hypothetical protein
MSMKNSMTPSGIEPETFSYVAQYLNHCATAVSHLVPEDGVALVGETKKI